MHCTMDSLQVFDPLGASRAPPGNFPDGEQKDWRPKISDGFVTTYETIVQAGPPTNYVLIRQKHFTPPNHLTAGRL